MRAVFRNVVILTLEDRDVRGTALATPRENRRQTAWNMHTHSRGGEGMRIWALSMATVIGLVGGATLMGSESTLEVAPTVHVIRADQDGPTEWDTELESVRRRGAKAAPPRPVGEQVESHRATMSSVVFFLLTGEIQRARTP
jgi:hypothetical protein